MKVGLFRAVMLRSMVFEGLVILLVLLATLTSAPLAETAETKAASQEDSGVVSLFLRYPRYRDSVRRQEIYPPSMPFPCAHVTEPNDVIENGTRMAEARSAVRPTTVHTLRPGDIDVVGGMGDSLVAGNGALEEWALGTFMEYRGVSWCTGGDGTWRRFLTLPNILREFNPGLKGFSRGTGEFFMPNSGFNVAFPTASINEALIQAKRLVGKMRRHPDVDFHNDWKMVTVMFGANDLCSGICYDPDGTSSLSYQKKLMAALDYLRDNLPRTFVNLVPAIDVSLSLRVERSLSCRLLHRVFCSCMHVLGLDTMTRLVQDYHQAEKELIESGRYDKDDFTVELQPFMASFDAPHGPQKRNKKAAVDVSYITYDCFHFSQKGHALVANMLWNNMLQPDHSKAGTKLDHVLQDFRCPTAKKPFLFTRRNSAIFKEKGRQE